MTAQNEQPSDQQTRLLRKQIADLQHKLIQSEKMGSVGALASSMTHEFNNILTTIINYAKMGLRHKDNPTREKAFDKILSSGQRAAKITTGILAYVRNQTDRKEATDLVVLVKNVLVLVEKDLQIHRVQLQTDFSDRAWADVNANQIQQVLLNLIINARQAMNGGGRMFITVKNNPEDGMAEIAIRDTGSGIPAEKLPKIFAPFFSTKQADAQGQGGTGLGLALCREVIEEHNGRIRVESTVGKGTTFTLRFPAVIAPSMANTSNAQTTDSVLISRAG